MFFVFVNINCIRGFGSNCHLRIGFLLREWGKVHFYFLENRQFFQPLRQFEPSRRNDVLRLPIQVFFLGKLPLKGCFQKCLYFDMSCQTLFFLRGLNRPMPRLHFLLFDALLQPRVIHQRNGLLGNCLDWLGFDHQYWNRLFWRCIFY